MVTKIITYSFYLLFTLTPLVFAPFNSELFEFNKMVVVYLLTVIITTTWLIKMVQTKSFLAKKNTFGYSDHFVFS